MTGDNNALPKSSGDRLSEDELVPMGSGPVVVLNKSRKMSIYGPKFDCGPAQLRKQRLLDKMKKEAEEAMAKKIAELKAAQKELDERLARAAEEAAKQKERENTPANDENQLGHATHHEFNNLYAKKL